MAVDFVNPGRDQQHIMAEMNRGFQRQCEECDRVCLDEEGGECEKLTGKDAQIALLKTDLQIARDGELGASMLKGAAEARVKELEAALKTTVKTLVHLRTRAVDMAHKKADMAAAERRITELLAT